MDDTNELRPLDQVARALRVPTRWLRSEAEAGCVPCLKAGNRYLFDLPSVEAVLLERARKGKGARDA
ncbi:MAG: hypothetical protein KAS72_12725 [Phycisphaerales bacterium]|nr:hypothetical protein [Phycisphaerales bacterium]